MRNNLKKKVCSLLVATLMTTATFANGFTYGGHGIGRRKQRNSSE